MDPGIATHGHAATAVEDDPWSDPERPERHGVTGLMNENGDHREDDPWQQQPIRVPLDPEHDGQEQERRPDLDRDTQDAERGGGQATDSSAVRPTASPSAAPVQPTRRSR